MARWATRLAEFTMTIKHRYGKHFLCADFLSRFIHNSIEDFIPHWAFIYTIAIPYVPTISEIVVVQHSEPLYPGQNYIWKDGIVYHALKIWVPTSLHLSVVEGFHPSMLFYYPGIKRTLAAIRKVWCVCYVARCIYAWSECQRVRPGVESLQGSLHFYCVDGPFHTVYMDLYSFTVNAVSYIVLCMIDFHSKWVESTFVENQSSPTVASAFVCSWVSRYGCPNKIITHNDPVFISVLLMNYSFLSGHYMCTSRLII